LSNFAQTARRRGTELAQIPRLFGNFAAALREQPDTGVIAKPSQVGSDFVLNVGVRDIIPLTMPLLPGAKLDGYEVLGLLGAGGMGEVYRARDPVLKREVAIKVLPSFVSQDPDRLRRFEQEAQAAAALNHANILAVHRFQTFKGTSDPVLGHAIGISGDTESDIGGGGTVLVLS
jgi:hypothetical protein